MARIIDAFTQFFDNSGNPLIKGKLKFLESGANNTDKPTFKDAAMTAGKENTNPVILDGAGRLSFSVFGSGIYNVILFTSDDVQIQQFDPVGASSTGSQFDEWDASEVYDKGDIVRGSDGSYYQSFINANSNNNPTTSPTKWDLITIVKSYIADASGTVDAITADFTPVLHALADNVRVLVRSSGPNTIAAPTFAANGLAAKPIVKSGNKALSVGDTSGEMDMVFNASIDSWELLNPSSLSALSASNLFHIQDQKGSLIDGGSSSGSNTRDLNTVLTNNITGSSLSTNQITLPAGIYYFEASAPAFKADRHTVFIRNITDSTDDIIGSSAFNDNAISMQTDSYLSGTITISGIKVFELRHSFQFATASTGLGIGSQTPLSIYADIKIWKVG